jgi:hypothetical protein
MEKKEILVGGVICGINDVQEAEEISKSSEHKSKSRSDKSDVERGFERM